MITSQGHDAVDQHIGKAGHSDGAGNNTGNAAGGSHGNGALCTGSQRLQNSLGGDTAVLIKETDHDGHNDGNSGSILDTAGAGADHIDQHDQRQQEI